jgi:tetratricopeptide (TPR) repeat protein
MKEVGRASSPERVASGKAYFHYLRARLAEAEGDFRTAIEELRLALAFDDGSAILHGALAEAYARLGMLDRAEDECQRSIKAEPEGEVAGAAHLLLAKIYAAQKQRQKAIVELKAAIAIESAQHDRRKAQGRHESPDPDAWRLLGSLYVEAEQEAEAVKVFDEVAGRVPGEGGGFREMGRLNLERREWARAERYFKRALEIDPGDLDAHRKLAQLFQHRRRFDEARLAYEGLLRYEGDDLDALLELGKLALRRGDGPTASAYFQKLLSQAGDEAGARIQVGFAYLEFRKPKDALHVIEDAARSKQSDGRLRFMYGLVLEEQRRWPEAAAAFALVRLEDGEVYASARLRQAYCLSQAGRHDQALRALQEPRSLRPHDHRLLTMTAYVLERSGKGDQGVELLFKAIEQREAEVAAGPDVLELYESLSSNLQRVGRLKEAINVLLRALSNRPREESLLYALGEVYEKSGDYESAVAQMHLVLTLNPEHAEALNFIGYTYAERGVKLDEAEKLVGQALQLRPDNGYFMDSLGWVYFKKGDYHRAVETLEKAEQLSGPEATILEHLGDAYRLAQRSNEAALAYRKALKLFDGDEHKVKRTALERKLRDLPGAGGTVGLQ